MTVKWAAVKWQSKVCGSDVLQDQTKFGLFGVMDNYGPSGIFSALRVLAETFLSSYPVHHGKIV